MHGVLYLEFILYKKNLFTKYIRKSCIFLFSPSFLSPIAQFPSLIHLQLPEVESTQVGRKMAHTIMRAVNS